MAPRTKSSATKAYTVRVTEQVMDEVRAIADHERRPYGTQIEILIEEALAARKASKVKRT